MSNSLYRLLKLAEAVYDSEDETSIKRLEAQFECFARKHCIAHYRPHNDGKTPNPWRRQMDYASYENSPYYGKVGDFLARFPGGIKEWREWREETKKERNQMWSEGPTKGEMGLKKASVKERMKRITELTGISKDGHFVPIGPDDVKKFEKEPLLYSDEGLEEVGSIEEFRKERKRWRESEARDVSRDVVKEFIDYSKLLQKVPEIRKKRRGRKKRAALDIKENKAKVNKLRKQIDDLKPLKDKDLDGLSAKDLQALKIALEGRMFELGKAKDDKGTKKGADEILKTNLKCLEKCLEKVKGKMKKAAQANTYTAFTSDLKIMGSIVLMARLVNNETSAVVDALKVQGTDASKLEQQRQTKIAEWKNKYKNVSVVKEQKG